MVHRKGHPSTRVRRGMRPTGVQATPERPCANTTLTNKVTEHHGPGSTGRYARAAGIKLAGIAGYR
ncbi:MAG: hypothetical protein ACLR8Y_08150 [Alistipes indistinctus]